MALRHSLWGAHLVRVCFLERSKNQDTAHKNPDFQVLLKPWKMWPSCKYLHVCACMPRSLLPRDVSFPGAPSLLAGFQAYPWRDSKVAWESSCANTFSVNREAGPGRD